MQMAIFPVQSVENPEEVVRADPASEREGVRLYVPWRDVAGAYRFARRARDELLDFAGLIPA